MSDMTDIARRRRHRGLALHHRRHASEHPRAAGEQDRALGRAAGQGRVQMVP